MKIDCPYLTSFKEYNKEYNNEDLTVRIYKCLLSNALLKTRDLQGKWACGGCTIPGVLKDKHCKHLTPHKAFFIRGISHTFLHANCSIW